MHRADTDSTSHNSRLEPGRRYTPGRVPMRAGNDVYKVKSPAESQGHPSAGFDGKRSAPVSKPALPRTARSNVLRRQMVVKAKEQKKKVRKLRIKHFFAYLFGALLIAATLLVAWSFRDILPFSIRFFEAKTPTSKTTGQPSNLEMSTLQENPVSPETMQANQVAPDAPKIIRIPKFDIQAQIKYVGATLTGEPIATSNIYDVGWFAESGKPNQPGAVLLNGHVAGPTKPGIFSQIRDLNHDDNIFLELGDGSVLTYTVKSVQEYSSGQINMSLATNSIDNSKMGLNLITTITKYSGVQKRVIVFAVL